MAVGRIPAEIPTTSGSIESRSSERCWSFRSFQIASCLRLPRAKSTATVASHRRCNTRPGVGSFKSYELIEGDPRHAQTSIAY